ncbi:MAG: MaoC family dehydratase N-terminal domain-containing protein [Deltaproteobacteria bacterium]|nr:MaoC family dehydratase N-terminal domain-containing protein [Deltaproteobacteria bacterium]
MLLEGLSFEDFSLGQPFQTLKRTITETDLVNFVTLCGFFEPLFLDRSYAETETLFQKPIVPGALTLAYAEGLSLLSGIVHHTGMAFLGLEMKVLHPVCIGDTIGVEIEVVEKRETKKPDRGIVTFVHRVINQEGTTVMEYRIQRMIRRRDTKEDRPDGSVGHAPEESSS